MTPSSRIQRDQRKLREIRKLATGITAPELRAYVETLIAAARHAEDESARLLQQQVSSP